MMKNSVMINCSLALFVLCVLVSPVWSCLSGEQIQNSNIDGFSVTYYETYKVVNNTRANETYVLYCSPQQPSDANVPQNVKGFFQIPVKNVASLDRTTLTYLEILGAEDSLLYVADKNTVTSPCLQSNDTIQNFAESNLQNVDVVFTNSTSISGSKYVTISLGEDLTPLANAEWVKFISLFYNLETTANNAYSNIESAYTCHANNMQISDDGRKLIAWVSYDFSNSSFTIHAETFHIWFYRNADLVRSTKGTLLTSDITELHKRINNVEFVIDQTQFPSGSETFDTWKQVFGYNDTSNLPGFLTNRRVYQLKKRLNSHGYDDWSEKVFARPDYFLLDLISIQYPTYLPTYNKTWLDNFSASDDPITLTGSDCKNSTSNFNGTISSIIKCIPQNFTGDGNDDSGSDDQNDDSNDNKNGESNNGNKNRKSAIIIIVCSIIAGLAGFGLGTWLLLWARKKYEERFIELKDEPEVQGDEEKGNTDGVGSKATITK